jgi:hypothetical protein
MVERAKANPEACAAQKHRD